MRKKRSYKTARALSILAITGALVALALVGGQCGGSGSATPTAIQPAAPTSSQSGHATPVTEVTGTPSGNEETAETPNAGPGITGEAEGQDENGASNQTGRSTATSSQNPFALNDTAAIDAGKVLFTTNCATCHGDKADGNGPSAANLNPRPANLIEEGGGGDWGEKFAAVSNGARGMPGFGATLTVEQRWQVLTYVWSLASGR